MSDICTTSFFYLAENNKVKLRPEFLKIPEVKPLIKMDDAEKVFMFINFYVNSEFHPAQQDKRRIDIAKNEARLPFDWTVTKDVQIVMDKFKDATLTLQDSSINTLKAVMIDAIAMLSKAREKIAIRIDALESFDFSSIDTVTEVNIADTLTKIQSDFKFIIDTSKSIVSLTGTINELEKKIKGDEKKIKPVDPLMAQFDN